MTTRVHVSVQRRDGAFERVMATMYRKRIAFTELHARLVGSAWEIDVELAGPARGVVAVLSREPLVVDVRVSTPAGEAGGDRPHKRLTDERPHD